jgi:hypothetical protein
MTFLEVIAGGAAIGYGVQVGSWVTSQVNGVLYAAGQHMMALLRKDNRIHVNGQDVCSKCFVPCALAEHFHTGTPYPVPHHPPPPDKPPAPPA